MSCREGGAMALRGWRSLSASAGRAWSVPPAMQGGCSPAPLPASDHHPKAYGSRSPTRPSHDSNLLPGSGRSHCGPFHSSSSAPLATHPVPQASDSNASPEATSKPAQLSFSKILVANRGEIACRVMRTAKRLGLKTVAIYSSADCDAVHVREADEAVYIGDAAAASSYLNVLKIIAACQATGTEAVHPGYGFLSENSAFAEALEAAGIRFVGPPSSAIAAMGDKVESKRLALEAGVNTIPGHAGVVKDASEAIEHAKTIGFPVMIKASAGGGGKGMRIAWNEPEVEEGFELATQEAISSFGDGRILIEKYVEEPRHIEIQLIADKHGSCLWLPERECSIQRRNQKVVEEAPSSFISETTRKAMGEQAVALARAVNYCSAGTVEFLVDKHQNFYFLEMNTRLQVEHPVTEAITGLDLVEEMLKVADDQTLSIDQTRIAKLVTHGASRDEAIRRMQLALDTYVIRGPEHNLPFLRSVVGHPAFTSGDITTAFIPQNYPEEGDTAPRRLPLTSEQEGIMLAICAAWHASQLKRLLGDTPMAMTSLPVALFVDGVSIRCTVSPAPADLVQPALDTEATFVVDVGGGQSLRVEVLHQSTASYCPDLVHARVNSDFVVLQIITRSPRGAVVQFAGAQREVLPQSLAAEQLEHHMPPPVVFDASKQIAAPMPGLIVNVSVEVGQELLPGDEVAVLEAMKMRNVLRADHGGVVKSIHIANGDSVTADKILVEFE